MSETLQADALRTADSVYVDELVPSPNIGERHDGATPKFLVLHYTGLENAARSIDVLCDPICEVSCHYLIDVDGRTTQMVSEDDRAWHAGQSFWAGETDINSYSIGIEIQNPGHEAGMPEFPDAQMQRLLFLSQDIVQRHSISAQHVLAHSDIAPQRKIDPGEKFDWAKLHRAGIGHLVAQQAPTDPPDIDPECANDAVRRCQDLLTQYGYDIAQDGLLTPAAKRVISAFQRHFRQARVDGLPDQSTIGTLEDLIAALPAKPSSTA